jgi:hypothetical protein
MEKVKIVGVFQKTSKNNKTYYEIQLQDGRKGTSWDAEFQNNVNKEVAIDVTSNKKGDITYLNFALVKESASSGGNTALRLECLKLALAYVNDGNPFTMADSYYEWVIK